MLHLIRIKPDRLRREILFTANIDVTKEIPVRDRRKGRLIFTKAALKDHSDFIRQKMMTVVLCE